MKTILIVEDDDSIRMGLQETLQLEHYNVLSAADGVKGYQLAQEGGADLILLDLNLPGKNGQEICRDLRSQGIAVPIIMLTCLGNEIDIR